MKVNLFEIFKISGEGLSLQRKRLTAIAKNIANANVTRTEAGEPYLREVVVAKEIKKQNFDDLLNDSLLELSLDELHSTIDYEHREAEYIDARITKDSSPYRLVYEPGHPDADENGYVKYPNVNVVSEMIEMISAQRAFEANINVIEAAKNVARDSMEI